MATSIRPRLKVPTRRTLTGGLGAVSGAACAVVSWLASWQVSWVGSSGTGVFWLKLFSIVNHHFLFCLLNHCQAIGRRCFYSKWPQVTRRGAVLHPALHFLFNFLFKFACFAGSALVRGQVVGIVVVGMFAKAQQAPPKAISSTATTMDGITSLIA